ncbi:hypothetical protein CATRI_12275 [Corynebacterium atrinae]|uniref:class I SAM-dependent DNA methyltransferase n=1 Tax=Corynebacterium atrinae TaxID=1336740 RepID=UPI0025B31DE2|nr:DNA methyltransferase [Corynebacterium atrinae]WJY64503.1 hypothetical protein CATRI_12275 [Corynebacterium atrinae]
MTDQLMRLVDVDDFEQLFRKLGWSKPDHPREFEAHGAHLDKVATYRGLAVWVCYQLPTRPVQRRIDTELSKVSAERLVIFTNGGIQDWRWPRHAKLGSVNAKLMAHRHETDTPDPDLLHRLEAMRIGIDDDFLSLPALVERMRQVFDRESETASSKAARLMGRLYEDLATAGMETSQATQMLGRLLFLWFGDDTSMWTKDAFHNWLAEHTTSENLTDKLSELFDAVNNPALDLVGTPGVSGEFAGLRYINGGLFSNRLEIPALPLKFRQEVLDASGFDWSVISPAIFGSMFQTVKDSKARREMGEHYTTEANILKTLRPLFLDELERKLEDSWDNKGELTRLHNRLAGIRLLDPACGCGNFLIVAYKEMRALELRLIGRRRELDWRDGIYKQEHQLRLQGDGMEDTVVRMSHFAGIEIEEWPAAIASTAMLLVDHLANQHMAELLGTSLVRLPIDDFNRAGIHIGNALRTDWADVVPDGNEIYCTGNPPFIGQYLKAADQKEDLQIVWGKDYAGYLDYVTGWYKKAADFLEGHPRGKFAFVSTNSIAQGQPVPALFRPLFNAGWHISFAHQSFQWESEAPGMAHVHCVIIGFERGTRAPRRLFTYADIKAEPEERQVKNINPYLVDGPDVFVEKRSKPLADLPATRYGSKPADGGFLIVEQEDYEAIMADPIAAQYVRPFVGARELIHGLPRWCLWLVNAAPNEIEESIVLSERVGAVRQFRLESKKESTRSLAQTPHLFGERRPALTPYVCVPSVVSERRAYITARHLDHSVIASNLAFTADDPDGFLFAIISSLMFMTWQRLVGGRLESRLRFSNTVVWNNFPIPPMQKELRERIVAAGAQILEAREISDGQSLAEQYSELGIFADLKHSHEILDELVDLAFGLTGPTSEGQRIEALFSQYLRLASTD